MKNVIDILCSLTDKQMSNKKKIQNILTKI
jgi:hypothetical protein